MESRGLGQVFDSRAADKGGRGPATEYEGADGEVNFSHKTGLEKRGVQFPAAFAEQSLNSPLFPQPAQCGGQVEFVPSENFDFIRHGPKAAQPGGRDAGGGENDDR